MARRTLSSVPASVSDALAQIYADSEKNVKCAAVATGGGGAVCGWLLGTPGASATVLEVQVPYLQSALSSYLGSAPGKWCSAATADAMAERALTRSKELWLLKHGGDPQVWRCGCA